MHNKQLKKEYARLCNRELAFLKKHSKQQSSLIEEKIAKYVPEQLSDSLEYAFEKAFRMIFENGTPLVEKTLSKDRLTSAYKVNKYSAEMLSDRKSTKKLIRSGASGKTANLTFSTVEGIAMGLVGAGLPDIPVFVSVMLRGIYEIAMKNGFSYDTEEEQFFILKIIAAAMSCGDEFVKMNEELDQWIEGTVSFNTSRYTQIKITSHALCKEMLYLKFIQGIPIVGVVGGVSNVIYQDRILEYAQIQYQKRMLKKLMQ